jgi:hypothetical protein
LERKNSPVRLLPWYQERITQAFPSRSAKSSSIISLALKRKNRFTADSALGSFDIELGALRDRCGNDDSKSSEYLFDVDTYSPIDTVIELRKREDGANGTIACLLTVKLDANDTAQLGALAVANARQDVELNQIGTLIATYGTAQDAVDAVGASGITDSAFAQSLGRIVAKINVIVEVVDKTARVSISGSNNRFINSITIASPVRQSGLASGILAI